MTLSYFATTLRALREQHGLSQAGLAKLTGLSQQGIACWELDTREPAFSAVVKLAKALGVKVDTFVDPAGPPSVEEPAPAPLPRRRGKATSKAKSRGRRG